MWHSVRTGWRATILVVAAWRALSELLARMRVLRASGVLDRRIARRRRARIERALAAWRVSPARARDRARTPVRVAVATSDDPRHPHARVDQAVHVGTAPTHDLDDIGLLEAAMRRAVRDRSADTPAPRSTVDWGGLLDTGDAVDPQARTRVPAWVVAGSMVGVGLTLVALVRPLADAAPWLAVAGLALVAAAAIGARRR